VIVRERPTGSQDWIDVQHVGGEWIVASCHDGGKMVVESIPDQEQPRTWDEILPVILPIVPPELRDRELWLGYFFAVSDRYGDNLTAPGDCTYCETEAECQRSGKRYFAPPGTGEGPRKIANIVSVDVNTQPAAYLAGTLVLWDGGLPPQPQGTLTGLECYSTPGEPIAMLEANVRAWLASWPGAAVMLIGQAYDRNGAETDRQKLADLQALPLRLAVDFPQIKGILWFSDGRKGGTRDNEWWRPIHTQAAALVKTPGGNMPDPPVTPLEVRVAALEAREAEIRRRILRIEAAMKNLAEAMP
jgi:hypothetical protein